jgi:hypothetical protein
MSLEGFLRVIVGALHEQDVPFMLTGSLAGSYHGAPRATQDLELSVASQAKHSSPGPCISTICKRR